MRVLPILALLPLSSIAVALPSSRNKDQAPQHPLLFPLNATFRDLILSDIPAATTIILDAFSPGADIQYLYPNGATHRKEVWEFMNGALTQAWTYRNQSKVLGKVIDVNGTAVSMSIWNILRRVEEDQYDFNIPGINRSSIGTLALGCADVPGINSTRCLDYNRQFEAITQEYFHEAYPQQLYLNLLATHPKWDGNGFAARHLHWGKELSKEMSQEAMNAIGTEGHELEWPLTLLATPAGYPLYDSEGFASIKNATVDMLDGLGELWYEVMRWT